jgi:hypothetical protein
MRKWFVPLAVLVLAAGGWVALMSHDARRLRPPGDSLADFLARGPEPRQWRAVRARGREYLVACGPMRHVLTFPSGEAVYVFDGAGRLVDWTIDDGDDSAFQRRWGGLQRAGEAVPREEAARRAEGRR